jgi:hypothetical protein
MNAQTKATKALERVVNATTWQTVRDMLKASPTVEEVEVARGPQRVAYLVHPAGCVDHETAIAVTLEVAFGQPRVRMSHGSRRIESPADALAQAQAMVTAASLMAQLNSCLLAAMAEE